MDEGTNNVIAILAIAVVAIALINLSVTLMKVTDYKDKLTGFAAKTGYVNISVQTSIIINLSVDEIDWGAGSVNTSHFVGANLTTSGESSSVVGGNWSNDPNAITIQNLGSVNCSIKLQSDVTATGLLGGDATIRNYSWNVSNKDPNACTSWNVNGDGDAWIEVNSTQTTFCNQLYYGVGQRELYLDVKLQVPFDAPASNNNFSTITVTGDAAI